MLDRDKNYRKKCRTRLVGVPGYRGADGGWRAGCSINGGVEVGFIEKILGFGGQQALIIS